jgi:hypothetical protein
LRVNVKKVKFIGLFTYKTEFEIKNFPLTKGWVVQSWILSGIQKISDTQGRRGVEIISPNDTRGRHSGIC